MTCNSVVHDSTRADQVLVCQRLVAPKWKFLSLRMTIVRYQWKLHVTYNWYVRLNLKIQSWRVHLILTIQSHPYPGFDFTLLPHKKEEQNDWNCWNLRAANLNPSKFYFTAHPRSSYEIFYRIGNGHGCRNSKEGLKHSLQFFSTFSTYQKGLKETFKLFTYGFYIWLNSPHTLNISNYC